MTWTCPRCGDNGIKRVHRRICTECYKAEQRVHDYAYKLREGKIDPNRGRGRPKKENAASAILGPSGWDQTLAGERLKLRLI